MLLESDLLYAPHDTARTRTCGIAIGTARQQRVSPTCTPTEYPLGSHCMFGLRLWRLAEVKKKYRHYGRGLSAVVCRIILLRVRRRFIFCAIVLTPVLCCTLKSLTEVQKRTRSLFFIGTGVPTNLQLHIHRRCSAYAYVYLIPDRSAWQLCSSHVGTLLGAPRRRRAPEAKCPQACSAPVTDGLCAQSCDTIIWHHTMHHTIPGGPHPSAPRMHVGYIITSKACARLAIQSVALLAPARR